MIKEAFRGKNVFITGATGLVGKIIVEKLLWSIPDVGQLYLLIRPKKNVEPSSRLKSLSESLIFDRLRDRMGKEEADRWIESKLVAIVGDVAKDELGMSEEDVALVSQNCNIFIHSAATISFTEPMDVAINMNVLGTLRVFSLAKRCRNLDAFCHISTAYVNCNKLGHIEEKIYPIDYDPEEMLKLLLEKSPAELENMQSKITAGYPNTYTFTKNLSEHLLTARRGDVPLVIFRPAIIGVSYKEPVPGWLDVVSAASSLYMGAGLGLLKFVFAERADRIGDQVPADFVVNALIAAIASISRQSGKMVICHMGTSYDKPLTWKMVKKVMLPYLLRQPPRRRFGLPALYFIKSQYLYNLLYFMQYKVPVHSFSLYAR